MRTEETRQVFDPILNAWARSEEERYANRITSDEIAALKHADHRARILATTLPVLCTAMIRDLIAAIQHLFYVPPRRRPMCDNYGHIADLAKWTDHLPSCSDCGAKITARNQLRKAVPHK
jgi:hypothetical protein